MCSFVTCTLHQILLE